jgi:Baseplate J-like protein
MVADPVIDGRDRPAILADLLARAPGYVPEWTRVDATPAYALLSILAREIEVQAAAENGMPDRSRLAFLSTLGNSLLPAQAAAAPLVFQLMANAPRDVTLDGGSQVAAVLPPPAPSLVGASTTTVAAPIFSTDETVTLTRASLTTLYSVDPSADTYSDHSAALTSGFTFFDAMQPAPHQLHLGDDAMFRLPSSAEIQLSVDLAQDYAQSTTLTAAISATVTSLNVASAAGFPTAGAFTILVDTEAMTVTAGQGGATWTVTRGVNGTTSASHLQNAVVTAKSAARPILLNWEYLSADGWLPLRRVSDTTARLTDDGQIVLRLDHGPDAQQSTISGINTYWIRATVSSLTPSGLIGPLPGGYQLIWSTSPTITIGNFVAIGENNADPTKRARIVAAALSTITLDRSLPGASAGLAIYNFNSTEFVGRIVQVMGQTLVLAGVDPGRSITAAGAGVGTVLDGSGNVAMLDQLPTGMATPTTPPGATLNDAATGEPVGILVSIGRDFFVPLDSGADFLTFDVVTVDGSTQAAVKAPLAQGVTLSAPIQNATPGSQLILADALPVLRPEGADTSGVLPAVDTIFARVGFTKSDLALEAAFCDTAPLDTSNRFYPFGKLPQQFTTFYLASDEVFARQNAQVKLSFTMAQFGVGYSADGSQQGVGPKLLDVTIEYFGGDGWTPMGPSQALVDATQSFTRQTGPMTISFICPDDWQATTVNGQSKHWLRMRIDGGNYGHPLQLSVDPGPPPTVVSTPATLMPPVVATVSLQYTFLTNSTVVQHCLTYNDFVFADHSEDLQWPRRSFQPFTPVGDLQPAIHFGFSQQLPAGLVSLYFAANSTGAGSPPTSSPFVWEYASPRGWVGLATLDSTDGFSSSGFVQFIGPPDANAIAGLGGALVWIRARLKPDITPTALPGLGLWLNAVEAHQATNVQDGTLGSSDGNPGQTFAFPPQNVPVLPGEIIQVQEWTGRGDDWQTAVLGVPEADLEKILDPTDGVTVIAVWVTWHNVPFFYSSGPSDRVYTLESATGLLEFPTPPYGMIPPAGALITATYSTGGGLAGNVPSGTITQLHSGVSYIQSVSNPFAANAGSATETVSRAQDRATQRIRNRLRAVTPTDFEWIAREASPEVVRARCLSTTGPDGGRELGWLTLVVVPNSTDPAPTPSAGLLAEVEAALIACAPAAIAGSIRVEAPTYTALSVRADIVPLQADQAAFVEALVRDQLATFLHPLLGGVGSAGWDFGQPVYQSQIATLLEATEGVDYVALLQLMINDSVVGDVATIPAGALITQGDHQLKLVVEEG